MTTTGQMLKKINLWSILYMAFIGSTFGQSKPIQPVTEADYPLWGRLVLDKLSDKGKWMSYYMNYESEQDTLFVQSTERTTVYKFPKGHTGKIIKERYFIYHTGAAEIGIMDLASGQEKILRNAIDAEVSANGKYLLNYNRHPKNVFISTLAGNFVATIPNVTAHIWSNSGNSLLVYYEEDGINKVGLVDLARDEFTLTLITDQNLTCAGFVWSHDDTSVAFYATENKDNSHTGILCHYNLRQKSLKTLRPESSATFPKHMEIQPQPFERLKISRDGTRIFFGMRNRKKLPYEKYDSEVQIWYGNSKKLYPGEHYLDTLGYQYGVGTWWIQQNMVRQIIDGGNIHLMIARGDSSAIVGNTLKYAPNYKYHADLDLYDQDLVSGRKELIVENVSEAQSQTVLSTDGTFLLYFKNKNWWAYSLSERTHKNLTGGLERSWDRHEHDPGNELSVYGVAGWTPNNEILVYDEFDLWSINVNNVKATKLTSGREERIVYRILDEGNIYDPNYSPKYLRKIDLNQTILLEVLFKDDSATGFAFYNKKVGVHEQYLNKSKISKVMRAAKILIYVEERFNLPPRIVVQNATGHRQVKMQSNSHHKNYAWGHNKLISYRNDHGQELKGIVYYPPNYTTSRKFPMVVYIYEQLSSLLHDFVVPSLTSAYGFNVVNMLSKGYVVLMPDIVYRQGEPSFSALDCVTAGVTKVLETESIDAKRIGIMGHSFGGFQTSFIVTKSHLFAAAVSGSSSSDLISFSLSLPQSVLGPDIWRVENYQFRMVKSIYEDMSGYIDNSALYSADKIETPLLLFTGGSDSNVSSTHTDAFYFALRRLKKDVVMLKYPSEGHILLDSRNATDLNKRIGDWFAYYLKDDTTKEWIA